jgi:hypothetical protein
MTVNLMCFTQFPSLCSYIGAIDKVAIQTWLNCVKQIIKAQHCLLDTYLNFFSALV